MLPLQLAVTAGDPQGIGPEVLREALGRLQVADLPAGTEIHAYGPEEVLATLPDARVAHRHVTDAVRPGSAGPPSPEGGRAALAALEAATDDLLAGRVHALVTAPVSKEAIHMAGLPFRGHNEYLAGRSPSARPVMLFLAGPLRVALVTGHVPLRRVPLLLTRDRIAHTARTVSEAVGRWFGISRPRLALCAWNPHAGEGGHFGREERDVLGPICAGLRAEGMDLEGPLAADGMLPRAARGAWDAVLALYHDQGLIAVKTIAPSSAIQVTLGLPYLRTSPAHGTAFDIAGTGVADAGPMTEAIRFAARHGGPALSRSAQGSARPPRNGGGVA